MKNLIKVGMIGLSMVMVGSQVYGQSAAMQAPRARAIEMPTALEIKSANATWTGVEALGALSKSGLPSTAVEKAKSRIFDMQARGASAEAVKSLSLEIAKLGGIEVKQFEATLRSLASTDSTFTNISAASLVASYTQAKEPCELTEAGNETIATAPAEAGFVGTKGALDSKVMVKGAEVYGAMVANSVANAGSVLAVRKAQEGLIAGASTADQGQVSAGAYIVLDAMKEAQYSLRASFDPTVDFSSKNKVTADTIWNGAMKVLEARGYDSKIVNNLDGACKGYFVPA